MLLHGDRRCEQVWRFASCYKKCQVFFYMKHIPHHLQTPLVFPIAPTSAWPPSFVTAVRSLVQCWWSSLAVVVSDVTVPSLASLLGLISLYLQRRTYAWTLTPSGHILACCVSFNLVSKLHFAVVKTHVLVYTGPRTFGVGPPLVYCSSYKEMWHIEISWGITSAI